MEVFLIVLLYLALPYVEGMDRKMDIPDDCRDESPSNSGSLLRNPGEKGSPSRRRERVNNPQPLIVMELDNDDCLQLATRLMICSKSKAPKRLEVNPYTPMVRRKVRRSRNLLAGDSRVGMSIVGFSNVAGLASTTPFLQGVNKSSSESSDYHCSRVPPKFTLPIPSSEPNLFMRQELREIEQNSQDSPPPDALLEQFQKLSLSTEQSSKPCSIQPLHLACADFIGGQASSMGTTSQSLQQMGPSVQASDLSVASDATFKSIVKTAVNLLGIIRRAYTNRRYLQSPLNNTFRSLVALLGNVEFAFRTIENHPDYNKVYDEIGVSLFARMSMRIGDLIGQVQHSIEEHEAGRNFDLGARLERILTEDFEIWFGVLEHILTVI